MKRLFASLFTTTALLIGSGLPALSAAHAPEGAATLVNAHSPRFSNATAIASDRFGNTVVAYEGRNEDDATYDIYARRYNAAGVPQGPEFRVNTTFERFQYSPVIAMNRQGQFLIAWSSQDQDGSQYGGFAQRFDALGNRVGPEFQVNTSTLDNQYPTAAALNDSGEFAVGWDGGSNGGFGAFVQRYAADGSRVGGELKLNPGDSFARSHVVGANLDAGGQLNIVWIEQGLPGGYLSRFDRAGRLVGSVVTASPIAPVLVTGNASGDLAVASGRCRQTGRQPLCQYFLSRLDRDGSGPGEPVAATDDDGEVRFLNGLSIDADGDMAVTLTRQPLRANPVAELLRFNRLAQRQGRAVQYSPAAGGDFNGGPLAAAENGKLILTLSERRFVRDEPSSSFIAVNDVYLQRYSTDVLTPQLGITLSGNRTNTTPIPEGPAGSYSFNARFCKQTEAGFLSGLVSHTQELSNGNALVNRSRNSLNPFQPGGAGSEKDILGNDGYTFYALNGGDCVNVPYVIGLANRNRFTFRIDLRGDDGRVVNVD